MDDPDKWRCEMKRLNQFALATLVALATLITAEAASARPQVYDDSDALYSREIGPGG